MQEYIYDCSYCGYSIQTKGPYPYYNEEGKNVPLDNFHELSIYPAIGLMANIYCPKCDKEKRYIIAKYKEPVLNVLDIWAGSVTKTAKKVCHKCKKTRGSGLHSSQIFIESEE